MLEVCLEIQRIATLVFPDVNTVLTRSTDEHVSHPNRGAISRDADYLFSVHANAATFTARGLMAFYWPGNQNGRVIADMIQRAAPPWLSSRSRKDPYPANFENWPRVRYVLKHHRPTAVLIELGFLTNKNDALALKDSSIQDGIVACILTGVAAARTLHIQREKRNG